MSEATAWASGRLGRAGAPEAPRLLFGRMYEDVSVELRAFAGKGRVFCIASAGDTALALAQQHAVVACDINPVQLAYARERAKGAHRQSGDADRAMAAMRRLMPLIGWRRGVVEEFLRFEDVEAQARFWSRRMDTRRLRAGLDVLLSRAVLGRIYSPALLASLEPKFGRVLWQRMERTFSRHANADNPYAWALLTGRCDEPRLAPRPAHPLEWRGGDAATVLETCEPGSFEGFTLSNILDGATEAYRARLMAAVKRAAAPGAVMVLRSFAATTGWAGGEDRSAEDRSILWGAVRVGEVAG